MVDHNSKDLEFSRVFEIAELARASGAVPVDVEASEAERAALADLFEARAVRKFRLTGKIRPAAKAGWELKGTVGATVVQSCVVTLEDVVTRIDVPVRRLFLPDQERTTSAEIVIDPEEADEIELLTDRIDVGLIATEAAALALPDYPRAPDAVLPDAASDGLEDEEKPNPFAALQALKDKLPPN